MSLFSSVPSLYCFPAVMYTFGISNNKQTKQRTKPRSIILILLKKCESSFQRSRLRHSKTPHIPQKELDISSFCCTLFCCVVFLYQTCDHSSKDTQKEQKPKEREQKQSHPLSLLLLGHNEMSFEGRFM